MLNELESKLLLLGVVPSLLFIDRDEDESCLERDDLFPSITEEEVVEDAASSAIESLFPSLSFINEKALNSFTLSNLVLNAECSDLTRDDN